MILSKPSPRYQSRGEGEGRHLEVYSRPVGREIVNSCYDGTGRVVGALNYGSQRTTNQCGSHRFRQALPEGESPLGKVSDIPSLEDAAFDHAILPSETARMRRVPEGEPHVFLLSQFVDCNRETKASSL